MPIPLNASMRGPITNNNFMNRPMGQPGMMNQPMGNIGRGYTPNMTMGGMGYMNNPLGPKPPTSIGLGQPRANPTPRAPAPQQSWLNGMLYGSPPKNETPAQRKVREQEFQRWFERSGKGSPFWPGPAAVPGKYRDFMSTPRANLNNIYAYYPQPQLTQQQMAGSAYGMPWLADLSRRVSPLGGLYG